MSVQIIDRLEARVAEAGSPREAMLSLLHAMADLLQGGASDPAALAACAQPLRDRADRLARRAAGEPVEEEHPATEQRPEDQAEEKREG